MIETKMCRALIAIPTTLIADVAVDPAGERLRNTARLAEILLNISF